MYAGSCGSSSRTCRSRRTASLRELSLTYAPFQTVSSSDCFEITAPGRSRSVERTPSARGGSGSSSSPRDRMRLTRSKRYGPNATAWLRRLESASNGAVIDFQ
jgi:hypothetical protein